MRMTTISGTDLRTSRFIFGTGGLLNAGSSSTRHRLLFKAVDSGFTHFDTAPYYGFGIAERDLAVVLRARPEITFTTKVGLNPPGGPDQHTATVLLRKMLGRVWGTLSRPIINFTVSAARQSLEDSLRRTGRERVDLYLLHDPIAHLVATEEWKEWLTSCVRTGKMRYFGLASSGETLELFLENDAVLGSVLQVRDSIAGREADVLEQYGRERQITYGYVTAALHANPHCIVPDVLRAALAVNPHGAIIVTSRHADRLQQYGELADREDA